MNKQEFEDKLKAHVKKSEIEIVEIAHQLKKLDYSKKEDLNVRQKLKKKLEKILDETEVLCSLINKPFV